jgi:hypothetical protein
VKYFFNSPVAQEVREEVREEGRREDRAAMILRIPGWRDIPVSESVRKRVLACADLDRLELWAERAVRATTAEDLFAGE